QVGTQQIDIAERIEHLVLGELVFVAQATIVQDAIVINDNGVVETAALCQPRAAQILDFVHESEGARTRNFLDEGFGGKIDLSVAYAIAKHRVVKIKGKRHAKTAVGQEADFF